MTRKLKLQFGISSIFIAMLLCAFAVWLGTSSHEPRAVIEGLKGTILLDGEFEFYRSGDIVVVAENAKKEPEANVTGIVFQAGSPIRDEDLRVLLRFSKLRMLCLSRTGVTDAGMPTLARLENVEFLSLQRTPVTDAGLMQLTALRSLKILVVTGAQVTDSAIAKFETARPDVRVIQHPT